MILSITKRIAFAATLACLHTSAGFCADGSLSLEEMRRLVPTAPTYLYKDKDGRPYAMQLAYEPDH